MTTQGHLVIVPVTLAIHGLRLPDGSMLAVELTEPEQKYALMIRRLGHTPHLHSLHDSEAQAQSRAADVERLWTEAWPDGATEGRRLQ